MSRRIRSHLNPATLLSLLALFAAFGGVSYAAATIGTSNLKNGAVTTKKLKKNAVTTVKIKDDAVNGAKVQESSLGQVPSAAKANQANTANTADSANTANSATSAKDAENLGGVPAASYGSGIVGAALSVGPIVKDAPGGAVGGPIGVGEFQMPAPVDMKVKNMFVKVDGDLSRPFVLSLRNDDGSVELKCGGAGACFAPGTASFEQGDLLEIAVTVLPGPAVFGGATYQVGYQIVP